MRRTRYFGALLAVALLAAAPQAASAADAPLADAAQRQDLAAVDGLLQASTDVNARQVDGMAALHWAAYHDDADLVGRLVAAGADVHAENRYGVTALSLAAENANVEMVRALLTAGRSSETPRCRREDRADDGGTNRPGGHGPRSPGGGADIGTGEPARGQTA